MEGLLLLTIYAPVIYTAPCIMFWMGAYTLRGEVGGGWALEFPSFLGPVKWERADRRVPFGAHPPNPTPHPEFIRNQHQTVRCIKGRSGA